jgi:hypothetical protein
MFIESMIPLGYYLIHVAICQNASIAWAGRELATFRLTHLTILDNSRLSLVYCVDRLSVHSPRDQFNKL